MPNISKVFAKFIGASFLIFFITFGLLNNDLKFELIDNPFTKSNSKPQSSALLIEKDIVKTESKSVLGSSDSIEISKREPSTPEELKLYRFLTEINSPLSDYVIEIVDSADRHGIPYNIVVAISMMESSGCKKNFAAHNCWGWAVHYDKAFNSYPEAIETVSAGLGQYYYGIGLDTPSKIMPKYCPPCTTWDQTVNYYLARIDNS